MADDALDDGQAERTVVDQDHSRGEAVRLDVAALQERLIAALRGEFVVSGVLGVGGFGAVFRAHDPVLERDVAIKVLDPATGLSAEGQDAFLAEARVVATVEHPHIVPLYRAEVRDGLLCLTMRMLPGRTLATRLATEGPLDPAEAARLAHEVSQALTAAHARGIVHRDIKPDNILLDAMGHAIVTDFGIALATRHAADQSAKLVVGTPQYMSPEQALGEPVDGRADVYSLGVVLYEMLAGRPPFEAASTAGLLARQILESPPPLEALRPDLPAELAAAVGHALAKAPGERPDARAFSAELARARMPGALVPPSVVRAHRRWRRIRWIAGSMTVIATVLALVLWTQFSALNLFVGGARPSLSASGANVPAALVAEALADGSVRGDEVVDFVFVQHGQPWTEALIFTDQAVIRRSATGSRRHTLTPTIFLQWFKRGSRTVFTVADPRGAPPDTLLVNLTGAELGALQAGLATLGQHGDRTKAASRSAPAPSAPRP